MAGKRPILPGEILNDKFIQPRGLTQKELADMVGCDIKVINRIVNGRQAVSPEMSVKLARVTNIPAEFWLGAQNKVDIWEVERRLRIRKPHAS